MYVDVISRDECGCCDCFVRSSRALSYRVPRLTQRPGYQSCRDGPTPSTRGAPCSTLHSYCCTYITRHQKYDTNINKQFPGFDHC